MLGRNSKESFLEFGLFPNVKVDPERQTMLLYQEIVHQENHFFENY